MLFFATSILGVFFTAVLGVAVLALYGFDIIVVNNLFFPILAAALFLASISVGVSIKVSSMWKDFRKSQKCKEATKINHELYLFNERADAINIDNEVEKVLPVPIETEDDLKAAWEKDREAFQYCVHEQQKILRNHFERRHQVNEDIWNEELYRITDEVRQTIQRAYRALCLKYHSDKNPTQAKVADEIFKEIQATYERLWKKHIRQTEDGRIIIDDTFLKTFDDFVDDLDAEAETFYQQYEDLLRQYLIRADKHIKETEERLNREEERLREMDAEIKELRVDTDKRLDDLSKKFEEKSKKFRKKKMKEKHEKILEEQRSVSGDGEKTNATGSNGGWWRFWGRDDAGLSTSNSAVKKHGSMEKK